MASGRTHERIALYIGATCGMAATVAAVLNPELYLLGAALVGGLVNGFLVTPDIDLSHRTREERRWKRIPVIGWPIMLAFMTFWFPYSLIFRHRGVSHWPIIGTFTRFIYQWGLVALALHLTGNLPPPEESLLSLVPAYLAGWVLQDLGHILLD